MTVTTDDLQWFGKQFDAIVDNIETVIQGKRRTIELATICLLSEGHALIEDVPGVGKTLLARSLARSIDCSFQRIQFTPDLLPSDVTGVSVWDRESAHFVFRPGPVFANVVLGDEINRASPKTQSALLEAMQERRVTVMGETRELPLPFFVLATQNPIELEGTYPLPEAQLDRFLFKLDILRNEPDVLEEIVKRREIGVEPQVDPVLTREEFLALMESTRRMYLPEVVAGYIARLVDATHPERSQASSGVKYGASPRAARR